MTSETMAQSLHERFNPEGSELRRLQLRQLDILKFVDRVCKEHNIDYWLSSGTCLGAARHGGFIPWDDDLDIEMLEKDFLRFCSIMKRENPAPRLYALQDHETDPGFDLDFAKVRDLHSEIKEVRDLDENYNMKGVFIDVFCMRPSSSHKAHKIAGWVYMHHITSRRRHPVWSAVLGAVWRLSRPVLRLADSLPAHGRLRHPLGLHFCRKRYYSEIFPLDTMRFEDADFPVPRDVDAYLRRIYGHYMRLPDPSRIEVHTANVRYF